LTIGWRNLSGRSRRGPTQRKPVIDGNIFNSRGVHVAIVLGAAIFDLKGKKLYDLRGINIYKVSGELVGHLANAVGADKHLDKATDKLFRAD
jgi:coproporphyrinogen III oxidase